MRFGLLPQFSRRMVTRPVWLLVLALGACSTVPPSNVRSNAHLTPASDVTRALTQLPEPRTRVAVAVYGFRDQTGQYKSSPESAYSTMVTQGAATILVKALKDSGWYLPVEREALQNLLTERRIVRAIESPSDKGKPVVNLPNLMPASLIIEGGVIGYETNVRTGGKGANYLGIGADTQYRVDQVTVGLRSIDIRTGQVLNTASVTKTIYSYQFSASIYKFVAYQKLLQGETGYTTNEPAQLAVREAIEAAVIHLTVQGVRDRVLELKNERDWNHPVFQTYLSEGIVNLSEEERDADDEPIPMPVKVPLIARPVQPILPADSDASLRVMAEPPAASANVTAVATMPVVNGPAAPGEAGKGVKELAPVSAVPAAVAAVAVSAVSAGTAGTAGTAIAPVAAPVASAPQQPSVTSSALGVVATAKKPAASEDIFRMYWQTKK